VIEAILDKEVREEQVFYEIKWQGHKQTSWEPLAGIYECWELIQEYEVKNF
jgi:hypothetical protein